MGIVDTLDISVPTLEINDLQIAYSIFPNPSDGIYNIVLDDFNSSANREFSIIVYNSLGEIILTQPFLTHSSIDIVDQPSGTYFYTILHNFEVLDSGVLLKVK